MDGYPDEGADAVQEAGIVPVNPWPAADEDLRPPNRRGLRFYRAPGGFYFPVGQEQLCVGW